MGTPGFAVTILAAIHGSKNKIVGVVTNVDKPAGRGKKNKYLGSKRLCGSTTITLITAHFFKSPHFLSRNYKH